MSRSRDWHQEFSALARAMRAEADVLRYRHSSEMIGWLERRKRDLEEEHRRASAGSDKLIEILEGHDGDGSELVEAILSDPDARYAVMALAEIRERAERPKQEEPETLAPLLPDHLRAPHDHGSRRLPERPPLSSLPVQRRVRTGLPEGLTLKAALAQALERAFAPGTPFDSGEARLAFLERHPAASRRNLSTSVGNALRSLVAEGTIELVTAAGDTRSKNVYRRPPTTGNAEGAAGGEGPTGP